jgi:RNA polymerase sigma-B factor
MVAFQEGQEKMPTASTLLRDWEFLQNRVVPALVDIEVSRSPRAWSIGSIEDAVAIGVAYEHAQTSGGLDSIELYADPARDHLEEVGFAFADLKAVPQERRDASFVRRDGRWIADDQVAEHVLVGRPSDLVDLVTLRSPMDDRAIDHVVEQLAPDGLLYLVGDENDLRLVSSRDLEFVESAPTGAIYRRYARTARPHPTRSSETITGGATTLVRYRTEHQLVEAHLRLARSLARRFSHNGEALEDLEQVAMLALVKAARGFDPSRQTRFATYATASILGELKRYFRDKAWTMRVPRPVQELYLAVKRANEELMQTGRAAPTPQDVAEYLETTVEAVQDAMLAGENYWPTSLDAQPQGTAPIEIPTVDGALEQSLERLQVQNQMSQLDEREQLVLRRIYFDNCNQRDVAEELDVSQMQVSRTLARAVAKLR